MFGFAEYFNAIAHQREAYANARKHPSYKCVLGQVEEDVTRVCYDRTHESVFLSYRVSASLDIKFVERMIKSVVSKNKVCLGNKIRVDIDYRRRTVQCYIPPHSGFSGYY